MAKRAKAPVSATPTIYAATLGGGGAVIKGNELSQEDAVTLRAAGDDVVVCGPDLDDNRQAARAIEVAANGRAKRCPPHKNAGPRALPHYQPDPRPPADHTFSETPNRKAK